MDIRTEVRNNDYWWLRHLRQIHFFSNGPHFRTEQDTWQMQWTSSIGSDMLFPKFETWRKNKSISYWPGVGIDLRFSFLCSLDLRLLGGGRGGGKHVICFVLYIQYAQQKIRDLKDRCEHVHNMNDFIQVKSKPTTFWTLKCQNKLHKSNKLNSLEINIKKKHIIFLICQHYTSTIVFPQSPIYVTVCDWARSLRKKEKKLKHVV